MFVAHEDAVIESVAQAELEACRELPAQLPEKGAFAGDRRPQRSSGIEQQAGRGHHLREIADVLESGDGLLFAAFVLRGFRLAAAEAFVERLARDAAVHFGTDDLGAAVSRVFFGIARAWALKRNEQVILLGLEDAGEIERVKSTPSSRQPPEILERVAILSDIFIALNSLFPFAERADAWLRKPNRGSLFGGASALEVMLQRGLVGMRDVRAYLQANRHGN